MRKQLTPEQTQVKQVFKRIKDLYFFCSDKELATYFGLSESFISQRVGRASMPFELLERVVEEKSVTFDYLILGKNAQYTEDECILIFEKVLAKAYLYKLISDEQSKLAIKQMLMNALSDKNSEGSKLDNELPLI